MSQPQSVEELQRAYDRRVRSILEDQTLAEKYKQELAEKVYNESRDQILQEVQRQKEELELTLRARRRVAFEAPRVARDRGLDILAYREALDRVKAVGTPAELEEILQSAELTGDEYLSVAVLVKAYELQSSRLVGKVLEFRPELQEAYESYLDAAEALNHFNKGQGLFGSGGRIRPPQEYRA
jgi:hypothetical protein